jgi:Tfp pilus assembly protein PilV
LEGDEMTAKGFLAPFAFLVFIAALLYTFSGSPRKIGQNCAEKILESMRSPSMAWSANIVYERCGDNSWITTDNIFLEIIKIPNGERVIIFSVASTDAADNPIKLIGWENDNQINIYFYNNKKYEFTKKLNQHRILVNVEFR